MGKMCESLASFGGVFAAMPATAIIGFPMYVCSTASIPIAALAVVMACNLARPAKMAHAKPVEGLCCSSRRGDAR